MLHVWTRANFHRRDVICVTNLDFSLDTPCGDDVIDRAEEKSEVRPRPRGVHDSTHDLVMFARDRYTEEFAKSNAGGDHTQVDNSLKDVEHAQRAYMAWLSAGKSEAEKECARAQDANSHAELKALARLEGNDSCADCTASRPGWAALPHGVFVCIGARSLPSQRHPRQLAR